MCQMLLKMPGSKITFETSFLCSMFLFFQCSAQYSFMNLQPKLIIKSTFDESVDIFPEIKINRTKVDEYINQIVQCNSMIGTAISIVQLDKNNSLVDHYSQGYGILDITKSPPDPADNTTKFCLGSITKQFTAGALGKALMAIGKNFDVELITLLGGDGRFFDTLNLGDIPTVRDLLSHRMSIPRYDQAWLSGLEEKREEVWKRLHRLGDYDRKYLAKKYRSSLEYNNWLVSLAGYILQILSGRSWEDEIRKTYFEPLNMTGAEFIHNAPDYEDFSQTAYRISGPANQTIWKLLDPQFIRDTARMIAPAGSICMSADDMEKYLTFLLNSKVEEDLRPLKASVNRNWVEASNIWMELEDSDTSIPNTPYVYVSDEYALCWERGVYKNYQHVSHGGNIFGYNSQIYVFPRIKLGIMVSSSQGYADYVFSPSIALGLFDLIMNTTKDITAEAICKVHPVQLELPDPSTMKPFHTCSITADSIDLKPLTGIYNHEVFGNLTVSYNESAELKFGVNFGRFGRGSLCRMVEDERSSNKFKVFMDVDGPFWYSNDQALSSPLFVVFERDAAHRGTRIIVPFLEPRAPTIESQTFYKFGYSPCDPPPCQNGGTCSPSGEFDFVCECPQEVIGVICEQGPRRDCSDLQKYYPQISHESGIKPIQDPLAPNNTINVFCDMKTSGGGWTVIHRRVNGNDSFNVTFDEYKDSIGGPAESANFWFGLERISKLADNSLQGYTLRIDLKDCQNISAFEEYKNFWLDGEANNYTFRVDANSYSGTAGDGLTFNNQYLNHNGRPFTTFDHDLNDPNQCAKTYVSGWWFNDCFDANLNGIYDANCQSINGGGIIWNPWRGSKVSLKYAQMMIRRTV